MNARTTLACLLLALGAFTATAPALAGDAAAPAAPAASSAATAPAAHPLTADDLASWLDGYMAAALRISRTPGAVVVVVKDGHVLYERGYGYADFDKRIPVDARTTLFRPGSTSKLFTWTAVMQLVEQGKLDLDADVNRYLDFQVPAHGKPITLRNIMTHRTGLEETIQDLIAFDDKPVDFVQVLKRYVPPQLHEPGTTPGYSNYATSLAGYIVQRVSGEPYEQYIERHVFAPLKMSRSTFRQPLPQDWRADMAVGYEDQDNPGKGYEIISMPPAGSLSATGEDMAHFMIAHLQDGRYEGAAILRPETAAKMHDTVVRAYPELNGNALGFYQQNINGHRVIAHGGDTNYFHTDLCLYLDDGVGLYVSVNALGKEGSGARIRDRVFTEFSDRYFPAAQARPQSTVDPATALAHGRTMAGAWVSSRRSDATFVSLVSLLMPTTLSVDDKGVLSFSLFADPVHYVEIKPWLWQEVGGHDLLQADVENGVVKSWSTDQVAFALVFEPATPLARWGLERPLAAVAVLVVLLSALAWPFAALLRRAWRVPASAADAKTRRLAGVFAWVTVAGLAAWTGLFAAVASTATANLTGFIHACHLLMFVGVVGGLAVAAQGTLADFRAGAPRLRKARDLVVVAAFALLLWFSLAYHLIGLSTQY